MSRRRAALSPEERLEAFAAAQALLAQISREVGPALDLQSTLAAVLAAMRSLVDFRGGTICLVDDGGVYVAAADPPVSAEVAAARVPVGQGLAGRIVATGQGIYSPDISIDERVDQNLRSLGSNRGMTSYLASPLICLGKVIGLLQVDHSDTDAFDEIDRALMDGLATQMANAIESARQFDEVMRMEGLKTGFIRMVSHELRTPLTIASGFLSTLRAAPERFDAEQQSDMLGRVGAALVRLDHLVEELVLMSRLAGGYVTPSIGDHRVQLLLEGARIRSARPADVVVDPSEERVRTDAELVGWMLDAIVDNALKYAGRAHLRWAGDAVEVVDHGPGFPPGLDLSAFRSFERGETITTTQAGLGLGLAMCQALAAVLGTDLQVSHGEGGGAVVRIPLRTQVTPVM